MASARWIVGFALGIAALFAPSASAQARGGWKLAVPDFPPGAFLDGRQYSLNDFAGKVVVLFFYEQNCPTCRGTIPQRNAVVEKFQDKPVVFIAIAAGDSLADARAYVRATGLKMLVFADNLSLMESLYDTHISLKNIYQFRVIGPNGNVAGYSMDANELEKIVATAKWKYHDQGYDAKLAGAIEAFELGNYADGVRTLRPFLKHSNKAVAESARKLWDAVTAEGKQWLADADAAAADQPAAAHDLYGKVAQSFTGEDFGKKAQEAQRKLAATPAVKDELAARQMWARLTDGASRATMRQKEDVKAFAEQIAKKYPNTPTGQRSEQLVKAMSKGE